MKIKIENLYFLSEMKRWQSIPNLHLFFSFYKLPEKVMKSKNKIGRQANARNGICLTAKSQHSRFMNTFKKKLTSNE